MGPSQWKAPAARKHAASRRGWIWKRTFRSGVATMADGVENGMLLVIPGPTDVAAIDHIARWFLTPISGSNEHIIATSTAWHGRLMVLGMGVLTPPTIIVARFFKVTPHEDWPRQLDNPFWFVTHRRWGHAIGLIVATGLAFALAKQAWQPPWHSLHGGLGWAVIGLVLIQVVGSWLRGTHGGPIDPFTRQRRPPNDWPGDHFSMTQRRIVFQYVHKWGGYILLALTLMAIPTGLVAADAPRWMPITMGIWWLFPSQRFHLDAARRPLHRHLSGDLGSRSEASRKSPASDRLRHVRKN